MKDVDYIVVGLGIAGLSFCEQLQREDKRFVVFDSGVHGATVASGGVFNPVVLKHFTGTWMAREQLDIAVPFYKALAAKLEITTFETVPVFRILKNAEEQNNWTVASDKKELSSFLSSEIIKNTNLAINAPFGYGKVIVSGRIFPKQLFQAYRSYLQKNGRLFPEAFQYDLLQENKKGVRYKDISARKIVFAEGAAAINNPFFPKQLLIPNKGEYIIITAPELQLEYMLKGPVFVIPLGNHQYKVGATYSREDATTHPTAAAKQEIVSKLQQMIHCPFEVIDQIAGVRPTTKDRRPILGTHTSEAHKVFFNGLGTRGILMAPFLAKMLYSHLEEEKELPKEVNMARFNRS
ncbi:MAG: FAD-binding oxidoreductase [Altibacter sp.]|uniref:NAD(P)/FAD-dependent oxidoreductase n=1 Tax=Altibacter sp. TaxID=2024823 RepID=UPI001DE2F9D2|nr:FAD-dependent oxidoreductase [Altibacter sp.]MBZ0327443.1 FAD-binding oxidoreductase [Altibacter sp.]